MKIINWLAEKLGYYPRQDMEAMEDIAQQSVYELQELHADFNHLLVALVLREGSPIHVSDALMSAAGNENCIASIRATNGGIVIKIIDKEDQHDTRNDDCDRLGNQQS